jgi:hypothetical protein
MCTEDQKLYYTAEENNLSLNVEKKIGVHLIKSPKQRLETYCYCSVSYYYYYYYSLSFFPWTWTCPRQISGTTGQNFMKLGGVIDICF